MKPGYEVPHPIGLPREESAAADHTHILHPVWWQAANYLIGKLDRSRSYKNGISINRNNETGGVSVSAPFGDNDYNVLKIDQDYPGQQISGRVGNEDGVDSGLRFDADMNGRLEPTGTSLLSGGQVLWGLARAVATERFKEPIKLMREPVDRSMLEQLDLDPSRDS